MTARCFIRLAPDFASRKSCYPDGAYAALIDCFCYAEYQPVRGTYHSLDYLRNFLGERSRWLDYLIDHHDLSVRDDGTVYVDGWEEWQEGDWRVGERMDRVRRKRYLTRRATLTNSSNSKTVRSVDSTLRTVSTTRMIRGLRKDSPTAETMRNVEATVSRGSTFHSMRNTAWASFGPAWDDFRIAWEGRGFRLPPAGGPQETGTQRYLCWQMLDAQPSAFIRWIAQAPPGSAREVLAYCLREWKALRAPRGGLEALRELL